MRLRVIITFALVILGSIYASAQTGAPVTVGQTPVPVYSPAIATTLTITQESGASTSYTVYATPTLQLLSNQGAGTTYTLNAQPSIPYQPGQPVAFLSIPRGYATFTVTAGGAEGTCGDATHSCQLTISTAGTVLARANIPITGGVSGVTSVTCAAGCTVANPTTTPSITVTGGGGSGCTPPATTPDALLFDDGMGGCGDASQLTYASNTFTLGAGGTVNFTGGTQKAPGTNGQLLFNNSGNVAAEDPIVSGATAIGSAPSTNPVFVATWDGTDIRVPLTTNTTPGGSDYALEVRNIPTGTQTISGTVTADQGGTWNIGTLTSITNSVAVTGTFYQATQPVSCTTANCSVNIGQFGGSNVTIGQQLAAASIPVILPSATISTLTPPAAITNFALETGGNLAAIKTDTDKIPSQGQALAAASMPVVLTAAQISTLTPLTSVAVTQATAASLNATVVGSGVFEVGPTTSANTKTNPFFAAPTDGTNVITAAISALGTAPTGTEVETVQSVPLPFTSGGLSTSYTAAGASTNATNVKNAAGQVYFISATNSTTTVYYLRMYNSSSAPTCSSATGYIETIPVGGASSGSVGGQNRTIDLGQAYSTGIGFCITGGASSTDNTNAAAGVYVTILYK